MIINDGLAYFNLAVYGDDATTSDLDEGITAGEPFTLRIWQALTNGEATYPNDDAPTYLEGWSNTNGAPIQRTAMLLWCMILRWKSKRLLCALRPRA